MCVILDCILYLNGSLPAPRPCDFTVNKVGSFRGEVDERCVWSQPRTLGSVRSTMDTVM